MENEFSGHAKLGGLPFFEVLEFSTQTNGIQQSVIRIVGPYNYGQGLADVVGVVAPLVIRGFSAAGMGKFEWPSVQLIEVREPLILAGVCDRMDWEAFFQVIPSHSAPDDIGLITDYIEYPHQ
jgi:hypothetical protein